MTCARKAAIGLFLQAPYDTVSRQVWFASKDIFRDENRLGWALFLTGVVRILGLIVNGTREKVTSQIRQISAGIGWVTWAGMTYGFASSDVVSL